jgi:hypothetical protein
MSAAIGLSAIDFLRLYIIDHLGAAVLHDARNAVQAIIGHTTLMQAQLAALTISSELPGKLLLAAERCGRSTSDVNTIFAIPTQRQSTVRLTGLLREQLSFFQGLLKDRKILNIQLNQRIDGVRIQQQPFVQLILLWIIRARDFLPTGGQMVLQVLSPGETSALSEAMVQESDRFIPFRMQDDGPSVSSAAQKQLTSPTPAAPDDAESMLCWLIGSLLQEVQAVVVLPPDSGTFQVDVLWPKVYLPAQTQLIRS